MPEPSEGGSIAALEAQLTESGDRKYVRTFLFSMRIGAPLSNLHVLTKFVGIVLLSFVLVKVMSEQDPDPLLAGLLLLLALGSMYLGGVTRWLFKSYMLVVFPMFVFLFLTWLAFTPDPGNVTYLRLPLYSGIVTLGVSASLGAFLLVSLTHFLITKKILRGVFLGLVAAYLIGELTMNPAIKIGELQFLKPYTFIVSDENLLVAGTKVVGYAAMVFVTLMFVMTTRDSELVGALRQLRVPYLPRFFLSIFFRTLELSLLDFQTIRQAQIARGIRVKQRTIFGVLRDMAMMSVPLVATMLQRSTDIGDSLLARGFSMDHHGQEYVEPRPLSLLDGVVFAILVVLTVAVLGYSLNMFRALQALFR